MLDFKTHRKISESTPAAPAVPAMDAEIDKAVDAWVSELIRTLTGTGSAPAGSGSGRPPSAAARPRGIWDRFKGTLANLWHGRYGDNNPYKWVNRFGDDLGVAEESFQIEKLSLSDYRSLRETCMELERQLNEVDGVENLRLVRLIRGAADKLKTNLKTIMATGVPTPSPTVPPVKPDIAPPKDDPAKSDPLDPAKDTVPPLPKDDPAKSDPLDPAKDTVPPKTPTPSPEEDSSGDDWRGHKEFDDESRPSTPPTPPESSTPSPPEEEMSGDRYTTPPTTGKSWDALTGGEIDKWNTYGGGLSPRRIRGDCFKFTKGAPIDYVPWILRLGDPRVEVLKSQTKGTKAGESFADKYLDQEKVKASGITNPRFCRKRHAAAYNWLMNMGRIETAVNPIKNKEDLMDRIEAIKTRPQNMPGNPDPDPAAGGEMPNTPPRNRADAAETDPASPSGMAPTPGKRRTVNRVDSPPAASPASPASPPNPPSSPAEHPTDNTSLSRPYGDEGSEPKRMNRREKRQFEKERLELEDKIGADDFPADWLIHYTELLQKAKSLEDLAKIKRGVDALSQSDEGELEDWNLSDYVSIYRNKLRNRVPQTESKMDKKVFNSLPITERVKYLKECLSYRGEFQ